MAENYMGKDDWTVILIIALVIFIISIILKIFYSVP